MSKSYFPLLAAADESTTSLGASEKSQEAEYGLDDHRQKHYKFYRLWFKILLVFCILATGMNWVSFWLGVHQGKKVLPMLDIHTLMGDAYEFEVRPLDYGFLPCKSENKAFMGQPRPELDMAWGKLLEYEAKAIGFESALALDGSGDMMGQPTIFHNLHCLNTLRHTFFGNLYPDYNLFRQYPPGVMNIHVDHCIENIRQALMCHPDMSLFRFKWNYHKPAVQPLGDANHVCVNWDKMVDWVKSRSLNEQKYAYRPEFETPTNAPHFDHLTINYSAVLPDPFAGKRIKEWWGLEMTKCDTADK